MGQTGEQSIAFLTADNKVICGYSLYKTDMSGNTAALEFWLNGKIVDTKMFTPSDNQMANPLTGHEEIKISEKKGIKSRIIGLAVIIPIRIQRSRTWSVQKFRLRLHSITGATLIPTAST